MSSGEDVYTPEVEMLGIMQTVIFNRDHQTSPRRDRTIPLTSV